MKSKFNHLNANLNIKWQVDYEKSVLIENFEDRVWQRADDDDDDWNIYWSNVVTIKNLFNPKNGIRLSDDQLINHFPNYYEIARKDLMVKNLKRYKKEVERENLFNKTSSNFVNFIPTTYILPQDYSIFIEEFQKNSNKKWILKPASKCQGKGIVLINKMSQVRNILIKINRANDFGRENYVICKYLDNPLLIGKKKFDMRMYVLVTNFKPLKIYRYNKGFCRFCIENYPKHFDENNLMAHLTNVAFQKTNSKYNDNHGGKFQLENFYFYIESIFGRKKLKKWISDIDNIFINTCKSVQNVIYNDKHCFELYGFDILVDKNLKPWLIELNSSPAWTASTVEDKKLKKALINDVINIVMPPYWLKNKNNTGAYTCKEKTIGNFVNIIDESSLDKNSKQSTYYKQTTGFSNYSNNNNNNKLYKYNFK